MRNLDSLLSPKSVAVIGASRDKEKLGRLVLDNIISGGYKGKVYPINPKAKKIAKLKCFPSVLGIKDSIDLAIIAIPAKFVLDVVRECCKKNVGSIAIISAGFSEVGQEGLEEELEMRELARKHGVNILGPNCLGVISTGVNLNATFAKNKVAKGNVAFLSQSGALGTAGLDWAEKTGIGFSHFISLGNKADLSENDFLRCLSRDSKIKVIALYLEDFASGKDFMKIAPSTGKPIVVLKPGKSEAAQQALGLHTGSLAQDYLISLSALKQCGVIRVETIEDLFNLLKIFSWTKELAGNRIAIITNAGGPGVVTTDAVELTGLKLAKLENKTRKLLGLKLPPASNVNNPVDVLGDARADRYEIALNEVLKDRGVDAVVVLLTPQVMTEVEETAKGIIKHSKKSNKVVISAFIGGKEVQKGREVLTKSKAPCFTFPVDAVRSISYVWEYKNKAQKSKIKTQKLQTKSQKAKIDISKMKNLVRGGQTLADIQAVHRILKAYKIPLLRTYFPCDIADARRAASRLGYPIVLKVAHERLLHRTEKDAVKLDIKNERELGKAYEELKEVAAGEELENYKMEMQQFVKGALELIVGVKYNSDQYILIKGENVLRREGFGHTIVFGMGGTYTEVYEDIGLRIAPLCENDIEELMNETKIDKILKGFRGREHNRDKIKEIIAKVSQLVTDFPQIRELDINPLFAKGKDVWVVDAKMFVIQ